MVTETKKRELPAHYKGSSSCPERDPFARIFYNILELCSEGKDFVDCERCPCFKECMRLSDSLSDVCQDRRLTLEEFTNFVTMFHLIIIGEIVTDEKGSTRNGNNSGGHSRDQLSFKGL